MRKQTENLLAEGGSLKNEVYFFFFFPPFNTYLNCSFKIIQVITKASLHLLSVKMNAW